MLYSQTRVPGTTKYMTQEVSDAVSCQEHEGEKYMVMSTSKSHRTKSKFWPVCLSCFYHQSKLFFLFWSISTDHLLCFKVGGFFLKGANFVVQYHQEKPLVIYI